MSISPTLKKTFLNKSEIKAMDIEHKRKLSFNIGKYNETVVKGKKQFSDLDNARKKAKNIKWKTMEHLDQYLVEFEKNFIRNGGKMRRKPMRPCLKFAVCTMQRRW
jgi:L-lactate dehydrogenase complex protein LldF